MTDAEKMIEDLENKFPPLSGITFTSVSHQVRSSGQSVLQSDGDGIYEVFPNGTRHLIKNIEKPMPVKKGLKITLS